ncbi:MAG: hypothetical protein IPH93_08930 [Saprospiraceae bacterium]|nr:hypothetical protein [Saprospiraceae bacterium]MBK7810617.1 hypothetical protein [Saprospiraceae bacterium]MBK9630209.1 hypothetical protein [Saprospiraceae bacterium]
MLTIKEKIIKRIEGINDEELLQDVYTLLLDIVETRQILILNDEQKLKIEEARIDYKNNRFYTNDHVFNDLLQN